MVYHTVDSLSGNRIPIKAPSSTMRLTAIGLFLLQRGCFLWLWIVYMCVFETVTERDVARLTVAKALTAKDSIIWLIQYIIHRGIDGAVYDVKKKSPARSSYLLDTKSITAHGLAFGIRPSQSVSHPKIPYTYHTEYSVLLPTRSIFNIFRRWFGFRSTSDGRAKID